MLNSINDPHCQGSVEQLDQIVSGIAAFQRQQQLEHRDQSQRPDRVTLESGVDGNKVRRTDQVSDHVLVQGVHRVAQFFSKG